MPSRRQRHIRKRVLTIFFLFLLVILGIGLFQFGKYLSTIYQYFSQKDFKLKVTKEKTINILLLGTGGAGHEGPNLTDTIIFASVDPNKKKVTLVSIPRDLWFPDIKQKINHAYASGEDVNKGSGLILAKAAVKKIIGQPIDYGIRLDFNGFVKAIDMVGGLDITVDNTFDDYQYPIEGKEADTCGHDEQAVASLSAEIATGSASEGDSFPCRYEHLHFDKGPLHLDGVTALKFVRSRHGIGTEGSDFARSKRQEKVITAFKEKVFSVDTFLNPVKVVGLINTFKDSIDTDIQEDEYDDFVKLAQQMRGAKISTAILDIGDDTTNRLGLLVHPDISEEYGNQWVLSPRTGNGSYIEIQQYISCEINYGNCIVGLNGILTPTPQATVSAKKE